METRIQPSFFSLLNPMVQLRTLYRHRDLLWQFTVRNVELRHKGSLLGFVWAVLNPLVLLALYVFVFSFVLKGQFGVLADETRWDYSMGVFLGLTIFHMLSESIAVAPSIVVSNPNFVKKVVFPLEVLPAAVVGSAVFHMLVGDVLVVVGVLLGGRGFPLQALLLPVVLLPAVGMALGLAWGISALGVFFRDIGQVTGALITALMFASAVFYSADMIPRGAWAFLRFNPLTHTIEMARDVVLWDRPVQMLHLLALYVVGVGAATVGYACFVRLKPAFADVI